MSISTLQEKFFNKGCGTALIVIAAVAMGASMFSNRMTNSASRVEEEGQRGGAKAVATVDGVPVGAEAIQRAAEAYASRLAAGSPLDATAQAMALVQATGGALQQTAIGALLARAPVTEAEAAEIVRLQIEGSRDKLVKDGKLRAGASDAELEKALKDELQGKTLAQLRKENPKVIADAFKNPQTAAGATAQFGAILLVQRLGAKAAGTDGALRDSYRTYVVRRIFLSDASGAKESADVRAQKALADLKAGKPFTAEMDAVSNDPPFGGKKIHDGNESVPASTLASRPELADLVGKAPNAMTPVVAVPGGKAIYQLVQVKDDLPKDFEANKAKYRAEKVRTAGAAELQKQVKELVSGPTVKWRSKGYQALAATYDATAMGIALDPVATKRAFDAGQAAVKSEDATDRRLGAQALLALTDPKMALGTAAPEAKAQRLAALNAAQANGIVDASLDLDLAKAYGEAKSGAKATEALIAASKGNLDYGTRGQQTFSTIAAQALDLQKKGVLTKAQLDSVQAQQATWTAGRAEGQKSSTALKANAANDEAANAAELARQKAEAQGTAPKGATPPPAKGVGEDKASAAEIARQKAEAAAADGGGTKRP